MTCITIKILIVAIVTFAEYHKSLSESCETHSSKLLDNESDVVTYGACVCGFDETNEDTSIKAPHTTFRPGLWVPCDAEGKDLCRNRCRKEFYILVNQYCWDKDHEMIIEGTEFFVLCDGPEWKNAEKVLIEPGNVYFLVCGGPEWSNTGNVLNEPVCCHNRCSVPCSSFATIGSAENHFLSKSRMAKREGKNEILENSSNQKDTEISDSFKTTDKLQDNNETSTDGNEYLDLTDINDVLKTDDNFETSTDYFEYANVTDINDVQYYNTDHSSLVTNYTEESENEFNESSQTVKFETETVSNKPEEETTTPSGRDVELGEISLIITESSVDEILETKSGVLINNSGHKTEEEFLPPLNNNNSLKPDSFYFHYDSKNFPNAFENKSKRKYTETRVNFETNTTGIKKSEIFNYTDSPNGSNLTSTLEGYDAVIKKPQEQLDNGITPCHGHLSLLDNITAIPKDNKPEENNITVKSNYKSFLLGNETIELKNTKQISDINSEHIFIEVAAPMANYSNMALNMYPKTFKNSNKMETSITSSPLKILNPHTSYKRGKIVIPIRTWNTKRAELNKNLSLNGNLILSQFSDLDFSNGTNILGGIAERETNGIKKLIKTTLKSHSNKYETMPRTPEKEMHGVTVVRTTQMNEKTTTNNIDLTPIKFIESTSYLQNITATDGDGTPILRSLLQNGTGSLSNLKDNHTKLINKHKPLEKINPFSGIQSLIQVSDLNSSNTKKLLDSNNASMKVPSYPSHLNKSKEKIDDLQHTTRGQEYDQAMKVKENTAPDSELLSQRFKLGTIWHESDEVNTSPPLLLNERSRFVDYKTAEKFHSKLNNETMDKKNTSFVRFSMMNSSEKVHVSNDSTKKEQNYSLLSNKTETIDNTFDKIILNETELVTQSCDEENTVNSDSLVSQTTISYDGATQVLRKELDEWNTELSNINGSMNEEVTLQTQPLVTDNVLNKSIALK